MEKHVRRRPLDSKVILEVAKTRTMASFVAAGIGVSLVPTSVAPFTIDGCRLPPPAEEHGRA